MSRRPLVALLVLTALSATAAAQPRARPYSRPPPPRPPVSTTFATATTYRACQTSWMFACQIPDGRGGTYGTAHPHEICTSYAFQPDGTVAIVDDLFPETATYRIVGGRVQLTKLDDAGAPVRWELRLSADGAKLGGFDRVGP